MSRGSGYDINFPSYSATEIITPAANATDIYTISGSASKIVNVTEVAIAGVQTAGTTVSLILLKRSAVNTGGTFTLPVIVPWDSANGNPTAIVQAYSVNPAALGTLVGNIVSVLQPVATSTNGGLSAAPEPPALFRQRPPQQALVLRGVGELLALNLNGVTFGGGSLRCTYKWYEQNP